MRSALAEGPLPRERGGAEAVVAPRAVPRFDEVYESTFAFAWRNARRLGVADAHLDDVVQEVFLTVHRRLADFEGRSSPRTWVFGILLRVVQGHRRSVRRRGGPAVDGPDPDSLAAPTHGPHEALTQAESLRLVHRLLDAMDDDKRAVLVLADLEQMPGPEIAEALGVNLNTMYARLRVARQELEKAVHREAARDGWRKP